MCVLVKFFLQLLLAHTSMHPAWVTLHFEPGCDRLLPTYVCTYVRTSSTSHFSVSICTSDILEFPLHILVLFQYGGGVPL